ncbi:MAG: hypothetical protein WD688_25215 [Candidatus Binatia bacterium]
MKRLRELADAPVSRPVVAEDVMELHAARLLLLFRHCGTKGARIDSLTKMAKLDFFVRYPAFFAVAAAAEGKAGNPEATDESRMVRYRYGPWDERYYQLLSYLEAHGLLVVSRKGASFQLELTDEGVRVAEEFTENSSFERLIGHMKQVKKVLGGKSGTRLKNLVYELFHREVGERSLGEVIE